MSDQAKWLDVPLIGQPYESVEDEQLDQWNSTIIDGVPVVVEGKLHIMKRPGLTEWIDLGTGQPVDGLYWWDAEECVLAVSAGRVWKITDQAGTYSEITGSTALRSNQLVSFADNGTICAMANGGSIVHTDLSTLTTMADAQAPTSVTHLAYLDGYLLANNGSTVQFSDVTDITSWVALDFFTAESRPDAVIALKEGFREIITLGRESVEFWVNDGQTPFSRVSGSAQPYGISAPHSLALVGSTWMWLSDKRQLVTMQGRQVLPVSSPYDRVIQRMTAVDDAVGYTMTVDGFPLYVLNFPTGRTTLVYNYITQQWHKWGYWDTATADYQRYRGQTYAYARSWNFHLVGDYATGIIYKASRQVYTDNGNPIRTVVRTGHVSHGAEITKRSNIFRIRCKRGLADATTTDPQVILRQRRDNGNWGNERWKSLGQVGQHEITIDWRRNGIYKTCQTEIVHADPTDFILIGAHEQIDWLGR